MTTIEVILWLVSVVIVVSVWRSWRSRCQTCGRVVDWHPKDPHAGVHWSGWYCCGKVWRRKQ